MAVSVVTITFEDGRVEKARLNPRCIMESERKFGNFPPVEGTLYAAWFRLGRPGGNFDAWVDTIADLEESKPEPPVPTQPEASEGS